MTCLKDLKIWCSVNTVSSPVTRMLEKHMSFHGTVGNAHLAA